MRWAQFLAFFLVARKKNEKKLAAKHARVGEVGQKHYKKEYPIFALPIFLKKKKKTKA